MRPLFVTSDFSAKGKGWLAKRFLTHSEGFFPKKIIIRHNSENTGLETVQHAVRISKELNTRVHIKVGRHDIPVDGHTIEKEGFNEDSYCQFILGGTSALAPKALGMNGSPQIISEFLERGAVAHLQEQALYESNYVIWTLKKLASTQFPVKINLAPLAEVLTDEGYEGTFTDGPYTKKDFSEYVIADSIRRMRQGELPDASLLNAYDQMPKDGTYTLEEIREPGQKKSGHPVQSFG